MQSKALREQRAKLIADARALTNSIPDGQPMVGEDEAKFDAMMAEADRLKAQIDRMESLETQEAGLGVRLERRGAREHVSQDDRAAVADLEHRAFMHYMRHGERGMPDDLRAVAAPRIQAAQSTQSGPAGGYVVAPDTSFMTAVESAMLAFGGMLEASYVFQTESGASLPIPTDNDTSNEGAILSENTATAEQDVSFGAVNLGAHTYSSKMIRVPNQLLQDSAFDLNAYLARKLGERVARIQNRHFTVGTGASQPTGVVTASALGVTAASATDITADEMIDLMHSVDPAYRANARYMFNDGTLKVLKKKKDGDGQYLWLSGLAVREPDTIMGKPYTINQHMASIATGNKVALFGDFSKYYIRRVAGVQVLRLTERYADYNQTAFLMFARADGALVDAGTNPIKHLINA